MLGSQQGISFNVALCKSLDAAKGAGVYLTLPPYQDLVYVGSITNASPLLCIKYPFPKFGAVQMIRVVARVMAIDSILEEAKKKKDNKVLQCFVNQIHLKVFVESLANVDPYKADGSMIVCNGEIHQFSVQSGTWPKS